MGAKLYSIRVHNGSSGGDGGSIGGDDASVGGDDGSLRGDDGSVGGDHSRKAFVLFAKIVKASNKIDVCLRQNVTATDVEFIFF